MNNYCPNPQIEVNEIFLKRSINQLMSQNSSLRDGEGGTPLTFLQALSSDNYSEDDKIAIVVNLLGRAYLKSKVPQKTIEKVADISSKFIKKFLKINGIDNVNINYDKLVQKLSETYLLTESKEEERGDGETERHDEAVSGTKLEGIEKSYKDQTSKLLSKTPSAVTSIPAKFKSNIVRRLFVNLDQGYLARTDGASFNRNLATYQNELFKNIVEFLNNHRNTQIINKELYSGRDFILNPEFIDVLDAAYEYINQQIEDNKHDDMLLSGWGSVQLENSRFGVESSGYNKEAADYYKFVESWINLKYFDNTLKAVFGDVISIRQKEMFNVMPQDIKLSDKGKYQFSIDKKSRAQGFTDENKRNGFTEAGRFSVALLTSLPMYSYKRWKLDPEYAKSSEENINQIRLNMAFSKILNMVLDGKIDTEASEQKSANAKFIDAVYALHGGSKESIKTILDYLFDSALTYLSDRVADVLSEKEMDTLFSFWMNVYNTNEEYGSSIIKLENAHLGEQVINKNGLVYSDCLSALIDRVNIVRYVQIEYNNPENKTKMGFRRMFYEDNYLFSLRDVVNNYINGLKFDGRKNLSDKYQIKRDGEIFTIKIDENLQILIDPNEHDKKSEDNIFTTKLNSVYIIQNGERTKMEKFLKQENFTSRETIEKVRDENSDLHKVLQLFKDVLQYDFLKDDSLQILHLSKIKNPRIFDHLSVGTLKSLINNEILKDREELSDVSIPEFTLTLSKYQDLFKKSGKIIEGNFSPEKDQKRFQKFGDGWVLFSANESDAWINSLSLAISEFKGDQPKSTSKNFAGNAEQNGRTGHLGANLHYYMRKVIKTSNINSPALALLGEGSSKGLQKIYRGFTIISDYKAFDGKIKPIRKLNTSELLFTNIFHNFYGMFLEKSDNSELKGKIALQPTTYSDKPTIELFMFQADKELSGKETAMNLSRAGLVDYLKNTVGKFYSQLAANMLSDYGKIFDQKFKTLDALNKFLQNLDAEYFEKLGIYGSTNEFRLIKLASKKGVELQRDTHYSIFNGKLGINPLLESYVETFKSADRINEFLNLQTKRFIESIEQSGLMIAADEPFVEQALAYVFKDAKAEEKEKWIEDGYLVISRDGELNPIFEKYFNAYNAITPSLRLLLTGSEIAHPLSKSDVYSFKEGNGFAHRLIESGIENIGKLLGYKNNNDFLQSSDNIVAIKNKIINKITDPNIKAQALEIYRQIIEELQGVAGAEGAQLKRNVIIPGTLQYVAQGALNSIPKQVKVAVIDDIKQIVNTFNGIKKKLDVHDGAALINPFFSILENMGLQDQAVNLDKKPIWHHYNPMTGTATLFKYATFTMTNLRMQQSYGSDVSLYNMFKKMCNEQWRQKGDDWDSNSWSNTSGSKIDLVNGRKFGFKTNEETGEKEPKTNISFIKDITHGKALMYGLNNEYWLIQDLNYEKFEGLSAPVYYTKEVRLNASGAQSSRPIKIYHLFDENSNHITTSDISEYKQGLKSGKYHTINSLFELHAALGGIFCVERSNGEFIPSEFNNVCIVGYMNMIGDARKKHLTDLSGEKNTRIETLITQEQYNQPLKQLMISMIANSTATKQGQSNVNPSESWKDNSELTYFLAYTDGYGIQQDSDHEADEAMLTEPTQVMTALAQGGSLHRYDKQIYQSIGRVTLAAAKVEISAVLDFLNNQKNNPNEPENINKLYDVVGRIVISNLDSNSSEIDLSEEILAEIRKEFGKNSDNHVKYDELKIAFSDPNLFSHIFPTIISVLNSKGIRRKNPGNGMVMAPAYGIYQTFNIDGKPATFTEVIRKINFGSSEISEDPETGQQFLINRSLSYENFKNKLQEYLSEKQTKKQKFDYNCFDLGDRINIIGKTSKFINIQTRIEAWKDDPSKTNNVVYFSIKGKESYPFVLKINLEEGYYDVHFRTLNEGEVFDPNNQPLTKYEKQLLINEIINYLKSDDKFKGLSTRGELSKGGFSGLNRFIEYGMVPTGEPRTVVTKTSFDLSKRDNSAYVKNLGFTVNKTEDDKYNVTIPVLKFKQVTHPSTYIDNIDKFYFIEEKNWLALSENKQIYGIAEKLGIQNLHEYLQNFGLFGFLEQASQLGNDVNQIVLQSIAQDEMLQLYNYEDFNYQENILKPIDLKPSRISFIDNETKQRRSIYTIPIIKNAFQNGEIEKDPFLMKKVLANIKNGFYYDKYDRVVNEQGIATYVPDETSGKHYISDIEYGRAQTIVSNMLATRFNTTVFKTLQQVQEEGLFNIDKFKQSIEHYPNEKFDMRFLKSNGNHTYITFSNIEEKSDSSKEIRFRKISNSNYRREKNATKKDKPESYSIISLNKDNSDFIETTRLVEVKDITRGDKGEYLKNGKIEPNQKQYTTIDGKIFKIFNFLKMYDTSVIKKVYQEVNDVVFDEKKKGYFSTKDNKLVANQKSYVYRDGKVYKVYNSTDYTQHVTYSIDYDAIKEMCELSNDNMNVTKFVSDMLSNLYNHDSYIYFDENISEESRKILGKKNNNILQGIENSNPDLSTYINLIMEKSKEINKEVDKILEDYYKELQTSFNKSLEVIASRIPSQTLQSFMSMDIVGFTQMETNVAYVSHIQTFLQGSDYDIDKSYMISYFFDDNGKFIKWSNLIDLSSIERLNESTKIPLPNGVRILEESDLENFTVNRELNRELTNIEKQLQKYYDAQKNPDSAKKGNIIKEETAKKYEARKIELENQLKKENDTKSIDITKELLLLKNDKSIENYANLIDKIDDFATKGYLNKETVPTFTTFVKYDENLITKEEADTLLDIIRSHENYQIPETIKEKALQNHNSAKIHLIINDLENVNAAHTPINMNDVHRITKRFEGKTKFMTLWNPATCFEMQVENMVGKDVIGIAANGEKAFFTLYYYFTDCYKKMKDNPKFRDQLKYLKFSKTFSRIKGRWNGNPETTTKKNIANLNPNITGVGDDLDFEVDQMISQLLSAATDNAKELALAKINANPEFAKIFFYGLILGFRLDDLSAFMTSSTVNLISSLTQANMFDTRVNKLSVDNVMTILDGKYYKIFYGFLRQGLVHDIDRVIRENDISIEGQKIEDFNDFCKLKSEGKIKMLLKDFVKSLEGKRFGGNKEEGIGARIFTIKQTTDKQKGDDIDIAMLSKFIENFTSKIGDNLNKEDYEEFKKLWVGSNEITTLTNVYLNTNQGLPTTLDDYLTKLVGIQNSIRSQEKNIISAVKTTTNKYGKTQAVKLLDYKGQEASEENILGLAELFKEFNPQYEDGYWESVAKMVLENDLIGTFDYHKWLNDDEYKQMYMEYYNCIKNTFNIFHFLEIHPQYSSNLELLGVSQIMTTKTNLKTELVLQVQRDLVEKSENDFWDKEQNKRLTQAIDQILIRQFADSQDISLTLNKNWKIHDTSWEILERTPNKLNLKTGFDYSNFKYLFEKYIVPELKSGKLSVWIKRDGKMINSRVPTDNAFIQGLFENVYKNRPYLSLGIDMSKRGSSESTNVAFAKFSQAFRELSQYYVPGFKMGNNKNMTVQDLFVLYNFVVNHNRYGSDRLTSLFKSIVDADDKHSLFYKYLKDVGESDISAFRNMDTQTEKILKNIEISMAPTISKYQLPYQQKGFYKVVNSGVTTLYEVKSKGDYEEYAMYAIDEIGIGTKLTLDQKLTVAQYGCLFNANDITVASSNKLKTHNPNAFYEALSNLIRTNKLYIFKKC